MGTGPGPPIETTPGPPCVDSTRIPSWGQPRDPPIGTALGSSHRDSPETPPMGTASGFPHRENPRTPPPWGRPRDSPCEDIPRTPIAASSRIPSWGHPRDPPMGTAPSPTPSLWGRGGPPQPHRLVLLGGASPGDLRVLRLLRHAGGCRGETSWDHRDPPPALGTPHPFLGSPLRSPPPSSAFLLLLLRQHRMLSGPAMAASTPRQMAHLCLPPSAGTNFGVVGGWKTPQNPKITVEGDVGGLYQSGTGR